ncbi:hypothetical protein AGMMS50268_13280 [Spirochaetia bacterium]|nr:hypothetical protein AGMMS50233_09540 [Endomicrobiia bacterium]GHV90825.1 hypothetical protein AGMMS50268_13280 [Spirochaetia bacterium]
MILSVDSDEGIVKIGSPPEELPGILESIEINSSLLIENASQQGRSGKVKIVQGWDDAALLITMTLLDDPGAEKTRWDSLKQIAAIFKKVSGAGKPDVYTLNHPMIAAWGMKQVLFASLKSSEMRKRRALSISIEFEEYDSAAGVIQDRQGTAAKAKKEDPYSAAKAPVVSDRQRRGLGSLEQRYASL